MDSSSNDKNSVDNSPKTRDRIDFLLTYFQKLSIVKLVSFIAGTIIAILGIITLSFQVLRDIGTNDSQLTDSKIDSSLINTRKEFHPIFDKYDSSLKILIMPLHPDQDCNIVDTEYEEIIIKRLHRFKNETNFSLNVQTDSSVVCIVDSAAYSFGSKNNADIILWGNYDFNCKDNIKINLKYKIINHTFSLLFEEVKVDDFDYLDFPDLKFIREGKLTTGIELIIRGIEAHLCKVNNQYQNAIIIYEKIQRKIYNPVVDEMILECLIKLNKSDQAYKMVKKLQSKKYIFPNAYHLARLRLNSNDLIGATDLALKSLRNEKLETSERVYLCVNLAFIYLNNQDYQNSLKYFDESILIAEKHTNISDKIGLHSSRIYCLLKLNNIQGAVHSCEHSIMRFGDRSAFGNLHTTMLATINQKNPYYNNIGELINDFYFILRDKKVSFY